MSGIVQQIALPEPKLAASDAAHVADEQFAALVRRQSQFVFRVAYSVLRNVHDAEDVVQETFLKLYRTQGWKRMNDERAFLARAAWRLAVERVAVTRPECNWLEQVCLRQTPEEELIRIDRDAAVQRLIDALPEDLRLPLALSTVEGLRSHEIAAVIGIPDGTVRSRIARARKILKERLAALLEGRHG
jgi:RNA polymerase sigma-70 factor (ECF subfamily)